MLFGSADLDALAAGAPRMPSLDAEPATLTGAEVLQAAFELPGALRECLLPAALHPTDPPLVWISVWRCAGGALGPFALAQVPCVLPERAPAARLPPGRGRRQRRHRRGARGALGIRLSIGFRRPRATVRRRRRAGRQSTDEPCSSCACATPIRWARTTSSTRRACTSRTRLAGLRLVQVDPDVRIERAERGRPSLAAFDAAAWGDARVAPAHPVSARSPSPT
jgi:hypothetical protein